MTSYLFVIFFGSFLDLFCATTHAYSGAVNRNRETREISR